MTQDPWSKHIQEREKWRLEAKRMLADAFRLSGLSPGVAEDLYGRFQVGNDYSYEYEVPPWQSTTQKFDDRSRASIIFLEAGKRFRRLWNLEQALRCFHWARWSAWLSEGEEFRKNEISAVHWIAEIYLILSERSINGQTYSEVFINEEQNREANELAARYQELEGHLELKNGDPKKAATAYESASFRYKVAKNFVRSARAAKKEADIRQSLQDVKGAAEALAEEGEAFLKAAQVEPEWREDRVYALFESGLLLAKDDEQRGRAADILLKAAKEALQIPEWHQLEQAKELAKKMEVMTDFGSSRKVKKRFRVRMTIGLPQRGIVVYSLTYSSRLYESIGEFTKEDECHYILNQYRRKQYAMGKLRYLNPLYLFSLILDVLWGYGTRPFRLVPVSLTVMVAFAILYLVCGDVNWSGKLIPRYNSITACLTLSVTSFAPAQLIDRLTKLYCLPVINVGPISLLFVWIESLLGLAIFSMMIFSISRWFKRRFVPIT